MQVPSANYLGETIVRDSDYKSSASPEAKPSHRDDDDIDEVITTDGAYNLMYPRQQRAAS